MRGVIYYCGSATKSTGDVNATPSCWVWGDRVEMAEGCVRVWLQPSKVGGGGICSLHSHYPIISPSLSSLYQSFSVSRSHSTRAPTSSKPLCYSLQRGLRWRDFFALFSLRVSSFPVQSAIAAACIYQQGDISCYECQGSTCDIILLLMAHHVIGPLIPLEMTAQTAA